MPVSDFKDRFKGKIGAFGDDGRVHGIAGGSPDVDDGEEVEEKVTGNRALLKQLMVGVFLFGDPTILIQGLQFFITTTVQFITIISPFTGWRIRFPDPIEPKQKRPR